MIWKIYFIQKPLGLFKGMSSPLVGVAVINAFLFGVYGFLLDVQQKWEGRPQPEPTLTHVFWAGAGSGLINSIISGPTELAKIQLQVQKQVSGGEKMRGPVDCLKKIYRINGGAGCLRGMTATVLRETPSYGVYFASFEMFQRRLFSKSTQAGEQESQMARSGKLLLAGGLSGILGWVSTYPIDFIKTRIQAQPIVTGKTEKVYTGMLDCARRMVSAEGYSVLWRGLGATIIRAFPTNAVIFLAYSTTIDTLDSLNYP